MDQFAHRAPRGQVESGLAEDLAIIREIVARAAQSGDAEVRLSEALQMIDVLRQQLADVVRPVVVDASRIAELTSAEVMAVARQRAQDAAVVLQRVRYDGDVGELWDLVTMFTPTRYGMDPNRVRAARAFLGQEGV